VYLGLDIGTSAVKAAVIGETGQLLDQASSRLTLSHPYPLWSEQHPEQWWDAVCAAVLSLRRDVRSQLKAVGLSGQMHGAVLLDRNQSVLRPAILWNDGRSGAACAELERIEPDTAAITGNRAMAGFTAPKLMWVRRHEPQLFEQTATVLLPKDYVRLRITGELASDVADSSGTLWMNVEARDWSDRMLAATGLTRHHMPGLFEGGDQTGRVRESIAAEWGIGTIPVVAGGGDNAAGAVSAGVVEAGQGLLSLGTSGVLFVSDNQYRANPTGGVHTFCHAVPNRWHQMAVILSAASCIEWAARVCGMSDASALLALIENAELGEVNETFLPYLSGERTPHNNPYAQGVLLGLTHESSAASIGQAVLEGVAFAIRDGFDALLATGVRLDTISVIGGGARSTYWGRVLSSILNRPLTYRKDGEVGPALGAARLAQLFVSGGRSDLLATQPPISHVVEPDNTLTHRYEERLQRYRTLYQSLAVPFFQK
jgi:xylulokinase